jgi:uncharacterized membrane protein YgcG
MTNAAPDAVGVSRAFEAELEGMMRFAAQTLLLAVALALPSAGCYAYATPDYAAVGYAPPYYNGTAVYYDTFGSPYVYFGDAIYYVPHSYYGYGALVSHYHNHYRGYHTWARAHPHGYHYGGFHRGGYRGGYHGGGFHGGGHHGGGGHGGGGHHH